MNANTKIALHDSTGHAALRMSTMARAVLLALAAYAPVAAMAGAGFGDTANPSFANGKVRSFYANSPSGLYPAGACFDASGNPAAPAAGGLCDSGGHVSGLGLRKFVDPLPGLGAAGASSTLGTYIPVAAADVATYADADYYEIAVVEYTQRMHSDLRNPATLRGYVQIDPAATDQAAGLVNGAAAIAGSQKVALAHPDGSPVLIARPDASNASGFRQVQAYAVEKPQYLGPAIVAQQNRPVRLKFYNALPVGRATNGQRLGDLFLPVDETLPGAGFGPDGKVKYTQNRAAVHLHGGDTPWISDGTPHQWIAPAGEALDPKGVAAEAAVKGVNPAPYLRGVSQVNVPDMPDPGPGAATYYFPNGQSARLMWYHDHTLGLTRLNAYAGMAAAYVLTDAREASLTGAGGALAGVPQIPLVIQDKTFVPDNIAQQDAKWDATLWGGPGSLWFSHVYETNQDPQSADGTNPVGRWDWGPFFWPVFPSAFDLPTGEHKIYAPGTRQSFTNQVTGSNLPGPSDLGLSEVTTTPEAFHDTPVVNGAAYPTLTLEPKAYRLRILNGSNDRMLNLGLYVAADAASVDPVNPVLNYHNVQLCDGTEAAGANCTEVRTVPFSGPNSPTSTTFACDASGMTPTSPAYPIAFPCAGGLEGTGWGQQDNRPGGVPDPSTRGPNMWLIGTEGGFVPSPVEIPATPFNYEYNKRSVTVLNILERGLMLGNAERADVVVDFSQYAGKTLILYNDAAAPVPAGDPRLDYYTGVGDQTGAGGAPNTLPGYGPNTRTVMQIKVAPLAAGANAAPYDFNALKTQLESVYEAAQGKPIVPQLAYAPGVPGMTSDTFGSIFTGTVYLAKYQGLAFTATEPLTYTPAPNCTSPATCQPLVSAQKAAGPVTVPAGTAVTAFVESKAIQELFDPTWGRMNATLGVEMPFTSALTQTTIPLAYIDPASETVNDGETQFWKITHNGVDTHPVHFHLLNVQVINRVGWDGTIKPPHPEEIGWKETVRMNPLEDILVAVRAKTPTTPFGMPHSYRANDPTQPVGSAAGFTQVDPLTGLPKAIANAMTDYQNEYVWHCHILGHEENDFMRPFVLNAKELVPAAFSANAGFVGNAVQVSWNDPTPVAGQPGIGATPPTTPGNRANEIGFRVERAPIGVNGAVGAYAALGKTQAFTSVLPPATTGGAPVVFKPTVNTQANAVSFTDGSLPAGVANAAAPAAPSGVAASAVNSMSARISWTAGGPSTGFLVFRDGVNIGSAAGNATSFTDTGASPGTHTYEVAAYNGGTNYAYRVAAVTAVGETFSQPVVVPAGYASSARVSTTVTLLNLYAASNLTANLVYANGASTGLGAGVELAFNDNSAGDSSGYFVEACVGTCSPASTTLPASSGVAGVAITNGGAGYTRAPTVTFSAAPAGGTTATGTAVIGTSGVASLTVTNGGSGYTAVPAVTFTAAPAGGTTASGIAVVGKSGVTGITITNAGARYVTAPSVTFSAPPAGGTQAAGVAVLGTGANAGRVVGISMTNPGAGYYAAPTVTLGAAPAGGTRATATASVAATAGTVTGITLLNVGAGYLSAPAVTVAAPTRGTRATASTTLNASAGHVVAVNLVNAGAGYTTPPTVTFGAPGAGGSTAQASASLGTLQLPYRTNFAVGSTAGPLANTWYPLPLSVLNLTRASAGVGVDRIAVAPITLASNSTTASSYAFRVSPMAGTQAGPVSNVSPAMNLRGTVAAVTGLTATTGAQRRTASLAWTDAANNNSSYLIQQRTAPLVGLVAVANAGSGYVTPPAVTFSAPPAGGVAPVATAVLGTGALSGSVVAITVSSPGLGYTTAPSVTLGAPPTGGTQATATAQVTAASAWTKAITTAVQGNSTAADVSGLASGTAYQFQVQAVAAPGGATSSAFVQVPSASGWVVAP